MNHSKRIRVARAFTLVEATLSTIIVGVMIVAALSTVGATRLGEYKAGQSCRGLPLAQDLLAEILQQAYEDPNTPVLFGPEAGEATSHRADFDDVDDYHNWSASPPQRKNGAPMNDLAGWERHVEVVWVNPDELSQTVGSDQNVKRITVTVTYNDMTVGSVSAFRTSVWPGLGGH